jgi:hypothetical protein
MENPSYLGEEALLAGLEYIRHSPQDNGVLELIVRRPQVDAREILEEGLLNIHEGLLGDSWKNRRSSRTSDGSPHPEMQLNIMNARVIALLAPKKERWALAGDQLFIDFDLSADNLPPGTQLSLGTAIIEVTAIPHLGCEKFMSRFGVEAVKFVNSEEGKVLHLRGINAKVVQNGLIRRGDRVRKI